MEYFEIGRERMVKEQVRLLHAHALAPIWVSMVVAVGLALTLREVAEPRLLSGWLSTFLLVSLLRVMLLAAYRRTTLTEKGVARYRRLFITGTYLAGAAWGAAALLLFPEHSHAHQIVLLLVLAGVAAGSIASLCACLPAAVGFLTLLLWPVMARMATLEGGEPHIFALLILLFWLICLVGARKINSNIFENIRLRLEAVERERNLRVSEERYRHIFSAAPLGIFQYDADSVIVDCNDAMAEIIGVDKNGLIGLNMLASLDNQGVLRTIKDSLERGDGYFEGEYTSVSGGKVTPVRAFFKAIRDGEGMVTGGIAIVEDFTEKKLSEQQIQYHMTYDSLTGLPNRRLLNTQLGHEITRSRRHGYYGALLFIDMDNFKTINDSLGHSVGDQVLKQVARRLIKSIRHEDVAARMGGDEFIVILTEIDSSSTRTGAVAREVAEAIRYCLSLPLKVEGYELQLTPSIGVSLFPKEGMGAEDILKQADTAMYRAKDSGRNEIQFFAPDMQHAADERLRMHSELRRALERRELVLFYQPQYKADGIICGAEALLRWHHPERGLLAPGAFLQVAEETGVMADIGRFVVQQACLCLSRWRRDGLLGEQMSISVNISARELDAVGFEEMVTGILQETGAEPGHLGIEITEGSLVSIGAPTIAKMRNLSDMGVSFSIDDFGTGYSSLSYLKSLPLHTLKIDRSFVNDIGASKEVVLVDTIIMLAKNLGLQVIAEGVENETELSYLIRRGCTGFQGYYFSRPLPEEQFVELLASSTR